MQTEKIWIRTYRPALTAGGAGSCISDAMVSCTGCRRCCAGCPQELDIPALLSAYNDAKSGTDRYLIRVACLPPEKQPPSCVGCGSCTRHCPRHLPIPEIMAEMDELLHGPVKVFSRTGSGSR